MKEQILNELREIANNKIAIDKDKYTLIANLLLDDDCFNKMNIETAYSILKDLDVEDIDKTYIELMKRK